MVIRLAILLFLKCGEKKVIEFLLKSVTRINYLWSCIFGAEIERKGDEYGIKKK